MKRWPHRETLKTAILLALVAGSFVLSARIWWGAAAMYRVPPREEEYYRAPAVAARLEELRLLTSPARIVLNFGGPGHAAFLPGVSGYTTVWSAASKILAAADVSPDSLTPCGDGVVRGLRGRQGVELTFPLPLPVGLWATLWRARCNPRTDGPGAPAFDRALIILDPDPALYLRRAHGAGYVACVLGEEARLAATGLKAELSLMATAHLSPYVELVSRPALGVADGTFVPADPPRMAAIEPRAEPATPDELQRGFFPDVSIVRETHERDRAVIYTDGLYSLRVYRTGAMEYNVGGAAPPVSGVVTSLDPQLALMRAAEFVQFHGGWPAEAYLAALDMPPFSPIAGEEDRYTACFSYRFRGMPVVSGEGALRVNVATWGVELYSRNVRAPARLAGDLDQIIPASRVLDALEAGRAALPPAAVLEDLYPGYLLPDPADPQGVLRPVWIARLTGGITVFFDSATGEGQMWTGQRLRPF